MNDRLEIASRILAATEPLRSSRSTHDWAAEAVAEALGWADKLIAAELATRPKCEHRRTNQFVVPEPYLEAKGPGKYRVWTVCQDCGDDLKVEDKP